MSSSRSWQPSLPDALNLSADTEDEAPLCGLEPVEFLFMGQHPAVRETVRRQLFFMGAVEVHEALDPKSGLRLLDEEQGINFILSGWELSGMRGADFLRLVRERPRWRLLPIVVISQVDSRDDVALAAELGATAWLVKPFSVRAFGSQIERICRSFFGGNEVMTLLRRGNHLLQCEDPEGSEAAFRKAASLASGSAQAIYGIGEARLLLGDERGAKSCFEQALALAPRFIRAHKKLARMLYDQGDTNAAVRHLEEAVSISPKNVETRVDLARGYRNLGEHDSSEEMLRKSLRIEPKNPEALNELSSQLLSEGRFQDAASVLSRTNLPSNPILLNNLGIALRMQGRYQQAEEVYQKALRNHGDEPILHHNLAVVYVKWGKAIQARECLERALALDPDLEDTQDLLRSITEGRP